MNEVEKYNHLNQINQSNQQFYVRFENSGWTVK